MKKINVAFQVGSSDDIEGVLAYCAERGIRSYSLRALLAALGRLLGRVAMRLTDIVVSLALLLTLFPLLYIVMAIVIKRSSPGPAIVVQPALRANGRLCGLFTFRMWEGGQSSILARAPRLINILLGQLSLFGSTPVLVEDALKMEVPPPEPEPETLIYRGETPDCAEHEEENENEEVDENLNINHTETENNVLFE